MLAVLPLVFGFQLLLQALYLDIQSVPREPIYPEIVEEYLKNGNKEVTD